MGPVPPSAKRAAFRHRLPTWPGWVIFFSVGRVYIPTLMDKWRVYARDYIGVALPSPARQLHRRAGPENVNREAPVRGQWEGRVLADGVHA
jgi:hypothetical protein